MIYLHDYSNYYLEHKGKSKPLFLTLGCSVIWGVGWEGVRVSPAGSGPWDSGAEPGATDRRAGGGPTPAGRFVCSGCCASVSQRGGGLLHKTDLLPLNLINQILPERASCSCWQVSVGEISDVARPSEGERRGSHKS